MRIEGRNDAPIALADLDAVGEDEAPIITDVLANDDDVDTDDDHTSLRVVEAHSASGADVQFSGLAGAEISYDPAGRFEYLAVGETAIDTITYTVEDRHGARATSTLEVTVRGANDAPTANGDNASIDEDSTLALPLLANDTDPDRSDRLQVTVIDGVSIAPGGRVTLASGVIVTMNAAGALEYDPRGHFDFLPRGGTATDSFRYRIEDGHGEAVKQKRRSPYSGAMMIRPPSRKRRRSPRMVERMRPTTVSTIPRPMTSTCSSTTTMSIQTTGPATCACWRLRPRPALR